jgi:C_GCAxxG_C_C family probable redox protein
MDNVNRAVTFFQQGFNCAQAILSVYAEQFELDRETALKLACGFGGGMRMGQTCGAVTAAFMVIGLKYGHDKVQDKEAKARTYSLVEEFAEKFESRNRSLGCDISTPDGMKTAQREDLFSTLCPKIVRDAAEILEEILSEHV